jgi:hypothetical protein
MKRGNCLIWALRMRIKHGGRIRIRRSPTYPMLPRTAWSQNGRRWWRYHLADPPTVVTPFMKWFPIHALWFRGKVIRDIG